MSTEKQIVVAKAIAEEHFKRKGADDCGKSVWGSCMGEPFLISFPWKRFLPHAKAAIKAIEKT